MKIRHRPSLITLIVVTLVSLHSAFAQLAQQQSKLVGTGGSGTGYQGSSVALSANGNTAIVGGAYDQRGQGAAWIWTRRTGVWQQQSGKLVGSEVNGFTDYQGWSVGLSADGDTAIVGGQYSEGAWVWTRKGDTWTQQGSKLTGSGATGSASQGFSVALSADGNTAIVGGLYDDEVPTLGGWQTVGVGAAWVWTRTAGLWTQQGPKLVGSGFVGDGADQGYSVAISADGNTAIVGGPTDGAVLLSIPSLPPSRGAVWVWTRSGGVWTQQGPKVVASDDGDSRQGIAVALSGDGNTALVGGYAQYGGVGAAWVWTRSGEVWTQQSKLVGSGAGGLANQGASVALSADGNTAIVGGFGDHGNAGAAWVWTRSGGVWTQQPGKIFGADAVGSALQGTSVSLSGDGKTAIVGGPGDNHAAGAAWVFSPVPPRRRATTHESHGISERPSTACSPAAVR